jgi:hypothetical protein
MSNRHRKDLKPKYRGPRYVQLFHWTMQSAAWRDLTPNARCILIEIIYRYNGANNGFIVYSIREAMRDLNVGHGTAARGFKELVEHGFIVPEQRGAFHWKIDLTGRRHRPASEWRLTHYDNDRAKTGESRYPTKEFMSWGPSAPSGPKPKQRASNMNGRKQPETTA